MSGKEIPYVEEAFRDNWIAPLGPNVNYFEKELAEYTGVKHVAVLISGTSAIHLALILLGVKPGDLVISQSFTFSATVNPIAYLGAVPALVDSERETWNMDTELLETAIQGMGHGAWGMGEGKRQKEKGERKGNQWPVIGNRSVNEIQPNTEYRILNTGRSEHHKEEKDGIRLPKAIIAVNLYGMPAKWEEILAIGNKYGIPVIEDAAESLGSRYDGRMCGSIGEFGILSFNGNKIITTSGGGALLSADEEMIAKARFLATQARDKAPHYQHSEIGYNYRMSNILAGIGRGQLEVIENRVASRRSNNRFYREALADIPGITFQTEPPEKYFSNFWLTTIVVNPDLTGGITREDIRLALEAENIESRPLWKPMHMQPVFADCPAYVNGVSEALFNDGLCLPSGSNMTENDLERVATVVRKVLEGGK